MNRKIKSYTDLPQSKNLAEILPLESADMWWTALNWQETEYYVEVKQDGINQPKKAIPCWSLAALLNALPNDCGVNKEEDKFVASYLISDECVTYTSDNPIDACYEMIIKLKELNLI